MKLKFKALALVAMMIAAPAAFAAAGDQVDLTTYTLDVNQAGDVSLLITDAEALFAAALGADVVYDQNVALITQALDYSFASIDQSTTIGSFASITQGGAAPDVAYVFQGGTGNMALINQQ